MVFSRNTEVIAFALLVLDPTPTQTNYFGYLSIAIGILLNLGSLTWWWRSGMDLRMTQRDSADAVKRSEESKTKSEETKAKVDVLESRVNQQEVIIGEIRNRMSKLDRVDEIITSVHYIESAITSSLVPRKEIERQWVSDNTRMVMLEREIESLRNKPK